MDVNTLQMIIDELIETCESSGDEVYIRMLLDALATFEE